MTTEEKIAEARALIEETEGHDPGPYRIGGPTGAGWSIISGGKHVGSAMGKANTGLFLAAPDLRATVAALADLAEAQAQEIARLRKLLTPEWFYPADRYDSEYCCHDVNEVLEEHYFWGRPKTGQHVVEINAATRLPSIWAAVRFKCECDDPDDCDCDNDMIATEHASEADARAALGDTR